MPCYERIEYTELKAPELYKEKFLVEGLTQLGYDLQKSMGGQYIVKEGRNVAEVSRKGKITMYDDNELSNIKKAYNTGMAVVSAKKRGLRVQKISIQKDRVRLEVSGQSSRRW